MNIESKEKVLSKIKQSAFWHFLFYVAVCASISITLTELQMLKRSAAFIALDIPAFVLLGSLVMAIFSANKKKLEEKYKNMD